MEKLAAGLLSARMQAEKGLRGGGRTGEGVEEVEGDIFLIFSPICPLQPTGMDYYVEDDYGIGLPHSHTHTQTPTHTLTHTYTDMGLIQTSDSEHSSRPVSRQLALQTN